MLSEEYKELAVNLPQNRPPSTTEQESKRLTEFCMYKITSLSEHKSIIEQPAKSEESKAGSIK